MAEIFVGSDFVQRETINALFHCERNAKAAFGVVLPEIPLNFGSLRIWRARVLHPIIYPERPSDIYLSIK
jgi:hypothetical protein